MTMIYLIRHGQAGSRDNYDVLSDLGKLQAKKLGEYLAERKIRLDAIKMGNLNRQQQTASIVSKYLAQANHPPIEITTDERWNEFSLVSIYQALASRLMAANDGFANDYAEMQQTLLADPHATRGAAGRCDRAIIRAWMEMDHPDAECESWADFRARVQSSLADLIERKRNEQIAIFTSATPIAIWVGMALSLSNENILQLMAVLYNSSVTMLKIRPEELLLLNFNTTPHLDSPQLQTFR